MTDWLEWLSVALASAAAAWGLAFKGRSRPRRLREKVVGVLQERGELTERELFGILGGRTGAARSALRSLRRRGQVLVEESQGRNLVRLPNQPVNPALRTSAAKQLVKELLLKHPGIPAVDIARHLGLSTSTVYRHMAELRAETNVSATSGTRRELMRSTAMSQAQRIEAQKALDELERSARKRSKAKIPSETLVREMRDAR